jgi:hypothetical protein
MGTDAGGKTWVTPCGEFDSRSIRDSAAFEVRGLK